MRQGGLRGPGCQTGAFSSFSLFFLNIMMFPENEPVDTLLLERMTIMMRAPWTTMAATRMASERRLAATRRASSSSPGASSTTAAVSPINTNEGNIDGNDPDDPSSSAANIKDSVTVRIVSINDVYDLTKLPR